MKNHGENRSLNICILSYIFITGYNIYLDMLRTTLALVNLDLRAKSQPYVLSKKIKF